MFIEQEYSTYLLTINDRQKKILRSLSEDGEMRSKDILAKLGNIVSERTIRHDLKKLKEWKIIGSHGKAQQSIWFLLPKGNNFKH